MKKTISIFLILMSILTLSACNNLESETKDGPRMYSYSSFEFMDTLISINFFAENLEQSQEYIDMFNQIYSLYHELSTGYEPLKEDTIYLENIYSINQKINQKIEIDFELYELLYKAEEIKTLTNGYFDVSIGKLVDAWKEIILDEEYTFEDVPTNIFNGIVSKINSVIVVENPYTLTIEEEKYYVQINSEHVKIDLGALSKGFATQKVYEYLNEKEVDYFSISAGSSSVSIGKNINRETNLFHISLANPVRKGSLDRTYGMIYLKDTSINTSGNYEQYFTYNNLRYHHVVSPKTKYPMQYYHSITIVGEDAGLLDALTTALFSMNQEVFNEWLELNQATLGIEIIRFNYDETVQTFLTSTVFEENR